MSYSVNDGLVVNYSYAYRCPTQVGSEMVGILHVCDMVGSTRFDPMEFDLFTLVLTLVLMFASRFLREKALPKELLSYNTNQQQE